MKRNKKNVLNSQYLINYDEFDELNETPNILNGTVKRDCVGRIPADCIRISTHHTDTYRMSRIDFNQDICEIIARKHFQYAKISVDPQTKLAIIVLNKVGGQCKIIQRSDSIRCSGCNINSKDLVDSILHFSGYERSNVGNILDFQFYSCDIENKEQTYTLFVLPQFLTLNHKR